MIKLHHLLSLFVGMFFAFVFLPTSVLASGSSLGVVRSGDTMYLSTENATNSATGSAYPQGAVTLHKGYSPNIGILITSVLTFIMLIAALLVLLQLVTAAFSWMTSGGDKGKIDEARSKIVAAVIGIIIVAAAWAIFMIILKFLGFSDYNDLFNNLRPVSG